MIIIGLTGSIAMGKSTTAKFLEEQGVPVFDADRCVHSLLGPRGQKVSMVAKHFPASYVKTNGLGYIDRKILGEIVFSDNAKRKVLERIIHPEVNRRRASWLGWAKRRRLRAVCYDIPLLFETKGEEKCDIVIVVTAPFFLQKQRAMKRKNMNKTKFENILRQQVPEQKKIKLADYIVKTGLGFRQTRNQIKFVIDKALNDK